MIKKFNALSLVIAFLSINGVGKIQAMGIPPPPPTPTGFKVIVNSGQAIGSWNGMSGLAYLFEMDNNINESVSVNGGSSGVISTSIDLSHSHVFTLTATNNAGLSSVPATFTYTPPAPPPTAVSYEFINNLGAGTVVSATVGVTVTYHGNPTTQTSNVYSGTPVKGQIAIAANSSSVFVAGLGVYNGIWGPGCGPTQYANTAGKVYVITFTNPKVVTCAIQQQ